MATRASLVMPSYERRAARRVPRWLTAIGYLGLVLLGAFYGLMVSVLPPQMLIIPATPIFVLLGLTLWIMPDRLRYPEATLHSWMLIFVALSVVWPSYIALDLPGLPWISFSRGALFILFAVFIYTLATSHAFRAHSAAVARSSKFVFWTVITYALIQLATLPIAEDISSSFNKALNNQIYLTALFFLGCWFFSKLGATTRLVQVLLWSTLLVCLISLWEWQRQAIPWANSIPSFLQVDPMLLERILGSQARSADGIYRVRGTFSVSLTLGEYLSLVLPFVIHLIVMARSGMKRGLLIGLWVIIATVMFYTNTRIAAVGFVLSHVGYAFLWGVRRWHSDPTSIAGPALIMGFPAIVAGLIFVVLSSRTLTIRILGGGQHQSSNDARETQWDMAIPHILENPLGHGAGMSGNTLQYFNGAGTLTVDSHFITTLLDFGVIGFVALYGMALWAAWLGFKLFFQSREREAEYAGPAAVALFSFVVIKSVLSQEDNHSLPFLFAAMVMALRMRDSGQVTGRPASTPPD